MLRGQDGYVLDCKPSKLGSTPSCSSTAGGGIGIHACLRSMSRKGCEFESRPADQNQASLFLA